MTKKEASAKIAKLWRMANDPRTPPNEAESARRQVSKLQLEHQLSTPDLETARMGEAFDELVGVVEKIVKNNPNLPFGLFGTQKIVEGVLGKIKTIEDDDKSVRLRQLVETVRVFSFIAGSSKIVSDLKVAVDTALKNHELVI